jgi:hypothetical protein
VIINGLHVALLFLAVAAVCIGMAARGSWRDVRRQIAEAGRAPQVEPDYEQYHFGQAHADHIERVERNLIASLKGDPQ